MFFSGCALGCYFYQDWKLSSDNFGKVLTAEELAQIFLNLESQGTYNINLVTLTQYLPHITSALGMIRDRLTIPVIYNYGGYETTGMILALKDYVNIWLPDLKYYNNRFALRYSRTPDYFEQSSTTIRQMIRQTSAPVWQNHNPDQDHNPNQDHLPGQESVSSFPLLKKGVIIHHMVLPGHKDDFIALLHWMEDRLPKGRYLISLMGQHTPFRHSSEYPGLNRRITTYEYNRVMGTTIELGLTQGFIQQKSSAKEEYTPPFDLKGL